MEKATILVTGSTGGTGVDILRAATSSAPDEALPL
jgi:hypothetical protein